jgi:hypothetical protein
MDVFQVVGAVLGGLVVGVGLVAIALGATMLTFWRSGRTAHSQRHPD